MGPDLSANPVCLVPRLPRGKFYGGGLFRGRAPVLGQDRGGFRIHECSVLARRGHDQAQFQDHDRGAPSGRSRPFDGQCPRAPILRSEGVQVLGQPSGSDGF